jgi:hypothetical protein
MIEIVNLEEFQRQVEALRAAIRKEFPDGLMAEMEKRLAQALHLLAGHAAVYPQQPAGSRYARTRTLGRLWTTAHPQITVRGHVIDARIGNATPYGPYVQDPEGQAWMHRGRWQTTDDVVQAHVGEVEGLIADVGLEVVERIAGAV